MVLVKPRRPLSPVQFLQETISRIVNAPNDGSLIKVLSEFDAPNHFERPEERNLTNWYRVLNRFDQLLERYILEHDIFKKEPNIVSKDHAKHPVQSAGPSSHSAPTTSFMNPQDPSHCATPRPGSVSNTVSEKPRTQTDSGQTEDSNGDVDSENSARLFTPSAHCVLLILVRTRELVRNASHDSRHVYNSVEHLTALLADAHSAIVLLSLEILHLLYQKSGKFRTSRPGLTFELIERLMEMSNGWGGREQGLGLVECCRRSTNKPLPAEGKQLQFKYSKSASVYSSDTLLPEKARWELSASVYEGPGRKASQGAGNVRSPSLTALPLLPSKPLSKNRHATGPTLNSSGSVFTVVIGDASSFVLDERWLLCRFASKVGIPKNRFFSLLYAFRRARAFGKGRVERIEACIIRIYALTILFLLHPMNPNKRDLAKETELLQDVIIVARAEAKDGLDDVPLCLRSVCILLLNAYVSDRRRAVAVLNITGLGIHHGPLTTLLRSEIRNILESSGNENSSKMDYNMDQDSTPQTWSETNSLSITSECMSISSPVERFQVAESLLALLHSLTCPTGTSSGVPFASSGVLNILVPLLSDQDASHSRIVARAIRVMQAIIEGSSHSSGMQIFREQNGLNLIAERIATETGVEVSKTGADWSDEDEKVEVRALEVRNESREFYRLLKDRQMTYTEAFEHQPPSSSATSRGQLTHSQWSLLRSLHQLLIPALGSGGSEVRELVANSKLPQALRKIIGQPFYFGGSLFQAAASVTTNIAHAEPTATVELFDAGIASTVLRSIELGLPPCGEAIKCIPNLLAALCLAPKARELIVSLPPLKDYLLRLATPFYTRALHGDIPVNIGNGLDELVRHVEALRESGNEAMEVYIQKSAKFIDNDDEELPHHLSHKGNTEKKSVSTATASDSKTNIQNDAAYGDGTKPSFECILLDKMKLAIANNTYRLAGMSQNSAEHQERLVKGSGLRDLIRMRKAIAYASAEASVRDGQNFSRHYPTPSVVLTSAVVSLRAINSRHPSYVLKSLFSVILQDSSRVLRAASKLDELWLPEEEIRDDDDTNALRKGEVVDSNKESLAKFREDLIIGIKILRLDVILLNGLLRGALGTVTTIWGSCGGAEVATIISSVERAARYHLAKVYTGLVLSAVDGDLTIAAVTAAANPKMRQLQPSAVNSYVGNVDKLLGAAVSKRKKFEEACKKYPVPPQLQTFYRQKVRGMAWHLVTYAVAAQNLYLTLSKGLSHNLRRNARTTAAYTTRARSLSATIGRIFVLHLQSVEPLWNMQVATMRETGIVAAWDYIRGVIIEIRDTIFDEHRRGTQSMILKAFFAAGGFRVLQSVTRQMEIAKVVAKGFGGEPEIHRIREALCRSFTDDPITTSSYLLALSEVVPLHSCNCLGSSKNAEVAETLVGDKAEMDVSSDSVTNQAKGIARIAVTDSTTGPGMSSKTSDEALCALLRDEKALSMLRRHVKELCSISLDAHIRFSVRKIASDVWHSLCGFLQGLGTCPGLIGTDGTVPLLNRMLEEANAMQDWTKEDVHRTSLTLAMRMLHPIIEDNVDLLVVFGQDDSASAGFVSLIHTASQMAKDTSKRDTANDTEASRSPDSTSRPEPVADIRIRSTPSPDPGILRTLTEMGFPERLARIAIRRTAPGGVEHATEWLVSHPDGVDDSLQSDEDINWDEDEQGSGDERDREQNSIAADEEQDRVESGDGPDTETNQLRLADDALQVPQTPTDEVMIDAGLAEPVAGSENENSHGGSSPPLSVKEDSDEPRTDNVKKPKPKVHCIIRRVDLDGEDLVRRSVMKETELLSAALRHHTPDLIIPEISGTFQIGQHSDSEHQSMTDNENDQDHESVKPVSVPVDSFKRVKNDMFQSLLEMITKVIHRSRTGSKDVSFLCVEILSALQKDGILAENRLNDIARLMKEGLIVSFDTMETDSPVSRIATLWAQYGGYRGRQSLRNCNLFDWAFRTLRKVVSELSTLAKNPNVDEEATQPIRQLSIKEEQFNRGEKVSGGRKRRYTDRGMNEASQPPQDGMGTDLPRSLSKEEQRLARQVTTCMLLLDACYRYEFKDNIIRVSKRDKQTKTHDGKDKKWNGEQDSMEVEDMTSAMDRAIDDMQAWNLFEDRDTQNESSALHRKESKDRGGDVQMSSPHGRDPDKKPKAIDISTMNKELNKIKDLAQKTKKAIVARTNKAISETIPEIKVEESERKQRQSVLHICIQCLRMWCNMKVDDVLIATLQLLASLTHDSDLAKEAFESQIVPNLLALPQLDSRSANGSQHRVVRLMVKTILRHIVEDPKTLEDAMVVEIQTIVGQPRPRSPNTVKSLLTAAAPLLNRNLTCFVSAASRILKSNDLVQVQVQEQKVVSLEDMRKDLKEYPNVKEVVWALSELLEVNGIEKSNSSTKVISSISLNRNQELAQFALETLADLFQLFPAASVAFLTAKSPSSSVQGSALDYVVQVCLTSEPSTTFGPQSISDLLSASESLESPTQRLLHALCSKSANMLKEAVHALAVAAKIEAEKENVNIDAISGIARYVTSGTKLRVLRAMLSTNLPNDLAKSLKKMDTSVSKHFEVTKIVLKALAWLGQAAGSFAKSGDAANGDLSFPNTGIRPWWEAMNVSSPIRMLE